MHLCGLYFPIFSSVFIFYPSYATIDVNFFEFQYLADHLTGKECNRLVASLHFQTFDLPPEVDAAERKIPDSVPCIDLLVHWNSSPREGKGETHVVICHRLNQIGRQDLAKWLSKTVTHELSKDLMAALTAERHFDSTTSRVSNMTEEVLENSPIIDEAAWWEMDSVMEILIVFCLLALIFAIIFLVFLCCTGHTESRYEKVNLREM